LNSSVNEILTRHPSTHYNVTYVSNTSSLKTEITKEILNLQAAVDGLMGTK